MQASFFWQAGQKRYIIISLETWLWYIHFCSSESASEFSLKLNLRLSSRYKFITIDLLADSPSELRKIWGVIFKGGRGCLVHSLQDWNVVEILV